MKKILTLVILFGTIVSLFAEPIPYVDITTLPVLWEGEGLTLDQVALAADDQERIFLAENRDGGLQISVSEDEGQSWEYSDLSGISLPENIENLQAVNIFYNDWCFLFTGSDGYNTSLFLLYPDPEEPVLQEIHSGYGEISEIQVFNDVFDPFYVLFEQDGENYLHYIDPNVEIYDSVMSLGSGNLSLLQEDIEIDSRLLVFLNENEGSTQTSLLRVYKGEVEEISFLGILNLFDKAFLSPEYLYGFTGNAMQIYRRSESSLNFDRQIDTGDVDNIRLFSLDEVDYLTFTKETGTELWLYSEEAPLMSPLILVGDGLVLPDYLVCPDEDRHLCISYYIEDCVETVSLENNQKIKSLYQIDSRPLALRHLNTYYDLCYETYDLQALSLIRIQKFVLKKTEYELIQNLEISLPESLVLDAFDLKSISILDNADSWLFFPPSLTHVFELSMNIHSRLWFITNRWKTQLVGVVQ